MDNQQLEHLLRKIDDLVSSQSKMSGTMSGLTSNARKTEGRSGNDNYADNFARMAKSVANAQGAVDDFATGVARSSGSLLGVMTGDLKNLQGAIQSSIRSFSTILGYGGIGGVMAGAFGGLTDIAGSMVTNFQSLSDSGKTFSGGIMDMATSAFESGKTISEYTEYMHKNSLVAAAMADGKNGGLAALASKVRNAGIQFGEFGYSISQLDDLTAQYAERRRATGSMEQLDNLSVHNRVIDLARDTTALSKAFGVSRDQLTKDTTNVIKGNPFLVGNTNKGIETLMTGIMAQGGPLSPTLAKIASMGAKFGPISDDYRDLIGIGPVGAKMADSAIQSNAYSAAHPEDAYMESVRYNNRLNDIKKNKAEMEYLQYLALTNKTAADALVQLGQLHHVDEVKAKRDHDHSERIDALTTAMESAGVTWSNTIASFSLGASSGLKKLFDNFQDPKFTEPLQKLMGPGGPITMFGERFGAWIGDFFTADKIDAATKWINGLFDPAGIEKANHFIDGIFNGEDLKDAEKWIHDQLVAIFGEDKVKMVTDALVAIDKMGGLADKVSGAFTFLNDNIFSICGTIVAGLTLLKVGFGVAGAAASLLGTVGGKAAASVGRSGVAAAAESTIGSIGKKAIPGLGDFLLAYENYQEHGEFGRALAVGAGSLAGRVAGGVAGSAVMPGVGTFAGEVGGSLLGATLANSAFGPSSKEKERTVTPNTTATVNLDHPSTKILLNNLSQTTQDTISPAMDSMVGSLNDTAEITNDKQTDALLKQLDVIKRTIVTQTEVFAGLINDLSGTVKVGNDSLSTIAKHGN